MAKLGFWVITILYFMVVLPLTWVIQGMLTPFEMIYRLIKSKGEYEPEEYWYEFATTVVASFGRWLENLEDEDEEEA